MDRTADAVITAMREEHAGQVYALYTQNFTERWSEKGVREELDNEFAVTTVALVDGQVAAFLNARHVLDEGDLNNIAVVPAFRKQHLGTRLMEDLFRRGREAGIRSYTLEVRASNQRAIAFYETLRFRQVGRRKQYYTNPAEDALLYRVELDENEAAD